MSVIGPIADVVADQRADIVRREVPQPEATYISLGTHCHAAMILKQMGYRTSAAPFDWIWGSLDLAADALRDEFRAFLNPRFHARNADHNGYGVAEHLYYREKLGISPMFNHHDITEPDVLAYYRRAAKRLLDLRETATPLRFVAVSGQGLRQSFAPLCDLLAEFYPVSRFLLVELEKPTGAALPAVAEGESRGIGRTVHFHPVSQRKPVRFDALIDDLALARTIATF